MSESIASFPLRCGDETTNLGVPESASRCTTATKASSRSKAYGGAVTQAQANTGSGATTETKDCPESR